MAEALVQSVHSTALTGASATLTWPAATTAGSDLAISTISDVSGLSVKDNTNTVWTKIAEKGNATDGFVCLFIRANAPSTTTITMTSGDFTCGAAAEYSGVGTSATANASGTAINTTAALAITVSTTTGSGNASDLVLIATGDFDVQRASPSVSTGYAVDVTVGSGGAPGLTLILVSNKGAAASGTESCTETFAVSSGKFPSVIASFSAAAGGAAFLPDFNRPILQAVTRAAIW